MALPESLRNTLSLPLVAAPMFIISNPDLVIAQCKAGVVGSFPALNARPAAELEVWLQRITSELAAYNEANPDQPAEGNPTTMDFGSGGASDAKAWKDIWGCGQGIGAVKDVVATADLVARLQREYEAVRSRLLAA